jgi:transitional endoplasmic reticulum ATPase
MSKDIQAAAKPVQVAEIGYHAEKIMLPEGMAIKEAIDVLVRREKYEGEEVKISRQYNVFPLDGAYALHNVLKGIYGWVSAEPIPSFFGSQPPQMISVETEFGKSVQVPWGRFSLPNVSQGYIQCSATYNNDGVYVFVLGAVVTRASESIINRIFTELETYLKTGSIYQGKAIRLRFLDDDGDKLAEPQVKFIDTSSITRDMVIYSKDVQDSVETNLFTPIERAQDCLLNGIPIKRGVLLAGVYGTGKTLAATVASKIAMDNNVTYIYIPHSDELANALHFAQQYQANGCVIFCEDIDRAVTGERSVEMDDILNILDGIDSKNSKIITVLTTNHLDKINPAMLRPGRLDAVINITAPNAEAVEKLLKYYGGATLDADIDLKEASTVLAGSIPATIAEVVKRAKLVQLRLQPAKTIVKNISSAAVLEAAKTMVAQTKLIADTMTPPAQEKTVNQFFSEVVAEALNGTKELLHGMDKTVGEIRERV